MATRYWVGGTGDWDASTTTHWSTSSGGTGGASAPGTSDDVIFDFNSGGSTTTVVLDQSVASITMTAFGGTLDTNDFTITVSGTFNLGSSGTRTVDLGASTINVGTWTVASSSGLTFIRGTSTINILEGGIMIVGNNVIYETVVISPPANSTFSTQGSCTFTTLTINCHASGYLNFSLGANGNIGTLNLNGASSLNRLFFTGTSFGFLRTISGNSLTTGQYVDIQDIYITSSPDLSSITGGSGDCGGNSGITFTAPTTQHWIAPGEGAGNWSDVSNWTSRIPLPQDDVVMDLAFGSGKTVTVDVPRMGSDIDWSGCSFTSSLTMNLAQPSAMYGSLTTISGMGLGGYPISFCGRSSHYLDVTNCSFGLSVEINATSSGTYSLFSDLFISGSLSLSLLSGTFTCDTFSFSVGSFNLSSGTVNLGTATHYLTYSGTVWNMIGNPTINSDTSTIKITDTSNSSITFKSNGTKIYNNLWFNRGSSTGDIIIVGNNTFNEFRDDGTANHSILFTSGNTQTMAMFSKGSSSAVITISSTTTGTHTLVKTGQGLVQVQNMNIQHSIATPGNTWFAGNNSVNNQSTSTAGSGWVFANHTVFRQPIRPGQFKPGFAR